MSETEFAAFLASVKRDAYVPDLKPASPGYEKESRYFGMPWMPKGMEWPTYDDAPMNFVLQLDLATIPWRPEGMPETGLLLFFHAQDYADPEEMSFVTIVDQSGEGGLRDIPKGVATSPAISIVGWRRTVDVPHYESEWGIEGFEAFDNLRDSYGYQMGENGYDVITAEDGKGYEEDELVVKGAIALAHTFSGDKIGGWPNWEQGDDTPEEPDGTRWAYFMQVGYQGFRGTDIDNESVFWPTWGTGHIYFHKGQFMYIWACD